MKEREKERSRRRRRARRRFTQSLLARARAGDLSPVSRRPPSEKNALFRRQRRRVGGKEGEKDTIEVVPVNCTGVYNDFVKYVSCKNVGCVEKNRVSFYFEFYNKGFVFRSIKLKRC